MASVDHTVWQQDDVDPAGVEQAMRALERERFLRREQALPARALNLVTVVEAAYAGEIARRLEATGANAPSRSILLRVDPGRTRLAARVTLAGDGTSAMHELVTFDIGRRHLDRLESIVDPVVMTDVPTLLWSPHQIDGALDALLPLAQTVMLDSSDAGDPAEGLDAALALQERHDVSIVDLSWLRTLPWRQRLASAFAEPHRRGRLDDVREVEVRHQPGSSAAAWLLLGWLADRLGWRPAAEPGVALDARGSRVALRPVEADAGVTGLAGATVRGTDGASFALDRNPGGLRGRDRPAPGDAEQERSWTIMGASRGEAGVLSAGLRRTLVPDDGYRAALAGARRLLTEPT
jgi:glucose-6-phosphate dehydrogenase assembly protein OpcA